MDLPLEYLGLIAAAEAGFYVMKTMWYFCLKNSVSSSPNQERVNSVLRLWKKGSLLPTPIDLAYIARGTMKLYQNNSRRVSLETEAEHLPLRESLPYSKSSQVIELVEEGMSNNERPYSRKRITNLVD